MTPTYVALDLETTGLSPAACDIIEVGAVRFTPDRVADTFHTFVRPRGALPPYIQRLTGIRPADVENAPPFAAIATELAEFLGDLPVVGHNVAFDLGFLAANGVEPAGTAVDTYDLATLLLPGLTDYSLASVVAYLGIDLPQHHRALADAQSARQAFLELRSRLGQCSTPTLAELHHIAQISGWPLEEMFAGALSELPALSAATVDDALKGRAASGPPLVPKETVRPLDVDAMRRVFARGDDDVDLFPGFERRAEQVEMAVAVTEALNGGEPLIVEAGTGTGKSLAYLAPGSLYALQNGARVVVSTDTINLQEQLMGKDMPLLVRMLGEEAAGSGADGDVLRFAQLKGRRNYLCLLRFAAMRRSESLSIEEARLLGRVLLWLRVTETGDRAELSLPSVQDALWGRISADNEACLSLPCQYVRRGTCFLHRARRRAEASHVLIVNHALLLSDVATGGHVLPAYRHIVIDEAHDLEEEATQQFGFQAGEADIGDLLDRIHRRGRARASGLTHMLGQVSRSSGSPLHGGGGALARELGTAVDGARKSLVTLFGLVTAFVDEQVTERGEYDQRLLLTRAMRVQPAWSGVEIAWGNLDAGLHSVIQLLGRAFEGLSEGDGEGGALAEELAAELSDLIEQAHRLRRGITGVLGRQDAETIAWLTVERTRGEITLSSAPLEVAGALQEGLFSRLDSAVLTGATLSVQGSMSYLCQRVGLEGARELVLGSPFDYEKSALLLVPRDVPEPNDLSYQPTFEQAVIDLCRASDGRALVLFTSHGSLRATHGNVSGPLEREGLLVLGQGIDGSAKQLLNALRANRRTVVFGTASFWEGVDVVGEALSLLVIARLPFAVPTDPVLVARSELYDDPFTEYMLPQAVIRFKQGFGRLIRRKTDRGVVVVLDRRIRSKAYGAAFLQSLPPCTVRELPLREAPAAVRDWLERA